VFTRRTRPDCPLTALALRFAHYPAAPRAKPGRRLRLPYLNIVEGPANRPFLGASRARRAAHSSGARAAHAEPTGVLWPGGAGSIHRGENLANPYILGTTNYQDVLFPGDLRDCTECHPLPGGERGRPSGGCQPRWFHQDHSADLGPPAKAATTISQRPPTPLPTPRRWARVGQLATPRARNSQWIAYTSGSSNPPERSIKTRVPTGRCFPDGDLFSLESQPSQQPVR
jgi:hypothetical protein